MHQKHCGSDEVKLGHSSSREDIVDKTRANIDQ